jgi:hypothetical protein
MYVSEDKTLLQEYQGVDIYVGKEDGKFYASVRGKVISKSTLGDIQKAISKVPNKGVEALLVFDNLQMGASVEVIKVTEYDKRSSLKNRVERYRLLSGSFVDCARKDSWGGNQQHLYFFDEEVSKELAAIEAEKRALGERWRQICKKLTHVTPDELAARLAETAE